MSFEIIGVQTTQAAIGADIADFEARLDTVIQYAGTQAEGIAEDKAAVLTGLMKASIALTPGYLWVEVHDYVYYSVFVDQGTRKMAAQPFMTPAYDQAKADLLPNIQSL
jgi:HK97 gp10 family phage protein